MLQDETLDQCFIIYKWEQLDVVKCIHIPSAYFTERGGEKTCPRCYCSWYI